MNPDLINRIADHLAGNDDISQEEARAFVAKELAPVLEDEARLDWLDAEAEPQPGKYPVAALTVKDGHDRNASTWVNIVGTAREAIDRAREH